MMIKWELEQRELKIKNGEIIMTIINKSTIKEFEELYDKAVKNNEVSFEFNGETVLVSYAKYLLEYFGIKKE